ncbi:Sperm-tail PG-rich repeat [Novymonas esmeraldas]|uniref:Sperm-tail PG-rich repeat n=1 Tax=Novymonas esmeraldas TaxID=1808958 RepID=A0AAW0ETT2_9TRYP
MPSATTSSSSSYAAYLREVTLEVGACVDPARLSPPRVARGERANIAARTAVTVPSCTSSPRPRSASRHRVAAPTCVADPDADDFMYDCVRVPETRSLSHSSAVRAYEAWQQQQQHRGSYHVSAHTTRTAALRPLTAEHSDLHRGSPSGGGLRCQQPRSAALTGRVAEEHRQRAAAAAATAASDRHTFRRLYAAMADEGRRHRDHAWPTAAAVYVPLAVLDDDDHDDVDAPVVRVGRVAAATGKAAAPTTSTDTSAITSSPARASSSPSSSSSSSSASAPRGRSRPRSGARHGASRPHRAVASRAPPAADTVRLRWPSEAQRSASAARGASTTRSRRCSRAVSPAAPRHRHRSCSDRAADARRGGGGGAVAVVSSTGSGGLGVAAAAASEAVLRDIASRTCACYWAEYPALPMATNPAAHAAGCPYQAHETLYTQMMNSAESESGDSASTRSRASSSALLERQGGGGHVASSRDAAPRQRCAHQRRKQQQQQQQQQQLAVSEERRQRGRGAVMGSAKRRTFMEAIMDAARDAPQPTARRGGAKVTSSPPTAAVAAAAASSARAPDDDTAPTPPPSPVTADAPLSSPLAESEKHSSSQASRDAPPPAEHAATTDGSGAGLETPSPTGAAGAAGVDADAGETAPPLHAAEEAESPLRSLSRPRRRPTVGVPGPGAYDVDVAYAAVTRGAVMAKAARLPPPRSITPGPGAYDVYKCEEEGRKAVVVAVAAAAAAAVEGGDAADPPPVSSPGPTTTSSRVAFASTGDRQLQLRHGDAFVPTAAWARRAAAVPGPGAYHVLDGDSRHDQSNPSRTSHAGSAFAKSADSAHYNVAAAATAAAGVRASLPLPWCDWAGGAYVGTSTTAFVVHPSLAGGDRRAIGAPPDSDAAAAAATVVDAGSGGGGGAWRGVGSGVALRLTSLRFPVAAAAAAAVGSSRGGPGPAAYEVASGLRWLQRRAPAASLVFRHDRGPRGPLRSGDADADLACAVSAAPGPGTYDVHRGEAWWRQRGPRWSFGTAARHGSSSSGGGGGGGDGAHEDGGHPGPGAYDTETGYRALLRGSTTTALLATATRFIDGVDDRVGPGTYDTEHGLLLLRTRVKGGVLPRAPRGAGGGDEDHDDRDDVGCGGPGPGAYTLPPLPPTGPTATLSTSATRFPWDAAAADVPSMPGPGSYDLAAATQIATRGGAIIGRAPRTSLLACTGTTATEVGPGRYTLPALPAGRAAVMTTVAAVGSGDEGERGGGGPGPGQYDPVDMNASTARSFTLARTAARFPASRAGSGEDGDGPGLGLYEVAAAAAATAAAPHGAVFATSARFPNDEGDRDAALVGPGSYDPYAMDGAAAVAHSLARAPRFPSDASTRGGGDGGVGPGAYEVVDLSPLGRGVVMGSAVARPADGGGAAAVPGPGAYSLQYTQVETAVPRVVLARAPAERGEGGGGRGGDVVPGPGQYDPEHAADQQQQQQHRRGYSFSAAPRSTMAVGHGTAGDVPGPGAYDARLTRDGHVVDGGGGGGGGARFGTAPRHDGDVQRGGASASPGPGAYAPELHATANAGVAGAVSFTTAPRLVGGGVGDVPGPGAYDPTMTLQWPTAPSVSFPRSTTATTSGARGAADDATPGPGAYSVQAEAAATRGVPFGAAPRLAEISDGAAGAPGPAAYAPTDAATRPAPPAHRFATAARHVGVPEERTDVDGHVGPGAYDVAAGLARSSTMPSAAVYSIPRAGDAGDHGSVRGATVAAAAADASPGPGAYSLEAGYRATLPRAAAATLAGGADGGGSWRGDHDEASPGPGSYAPPPPAPLHGGISIPRAALAPPPDAATASPGPGAYDVAAAAAAAAAGGALFGTAARWTIGGVSGDGASSSPLGPGAYSPNTSAVLKHTAAMSFAQAPRTVAQTTAAAADAVGPGAYDLPGDMATGAAAHRIGTAPRVLGVVADSAGVVGPGSYDVWTADAHVRPRAPAYTMAPPLPLTEALDAGQQPHPGPGSYDYPTDIHAHQRSALMLGRHGELAELAAAGRDTPGPGAYDAAAAYAATQLTQPQSCGVTIHGRPRPPATSAASAAEGAGPGPGAYAVEAVAATTAAHGFGTAARMPCAASGDTRVGPGAYDLPVQSTAPRAISFTQAPRAVSMAAAAAGAGDGDRGGGPGPGSYDVTTSAGAGGHAYTIPRGLRPVLRSGDVDASPCVGPGTYSPAGSTALPPGPSAAFGLAERPLNAAAGAGGNAVPGPGAYDPRHPGTIGATVARPSFGSAAREAGGAVEDTPGPGAYAVAAAATAVAPASRAVRVGTALRPPLALPSEAPGPGSYAPEADGVAATAGAVSFGRAPRVDALQHGSDHPGPGAYSHTTLWGSHGGVSVGAAARPTAEVLHTTPGPGAYYRATGQAATTAATFGSAAQRPPVAGAGVGTPGPGAYHTDAWGTSAATLAPGTVFGLAARPGPEPSTTPGPGTYWRGDIVAAPRGPSFAGPSTATLEARRRPTAADTLRKLASVGYPLLETPPAHA